MIHDEEKFHPRNQLHHDRKIRRENREKVDFGTAHGIARLMEQSPIIKIILRQPPAFRKRPATESRKAGTQDIPFCDNEKSRIKQKNRRETHP